jgi:hypothetical protein
MSCTCKTCGKVGSAPEDFYLSRPSRCRSCEKAARHAQRERSPELCERQRLARRCEPGVAATCRQCGKIGFAPVDFYWAERYFCRLCRRAFDKIRYAALSVQEKQTRAKKMRCARLARMYRLTPSEVGAMSEAQNGKCAICGNDPSLDTATRGIGKILHIDHCHASGKVRGLLCAPCNHGIGYFKTPMGLGRNPLHGPRVEYARQVAQFEFPMGEEAHGRFRRQLG